MIGYVLLAVGAALGMWLYIRASYRLDEREAEMWRAWRQREARRADYHVIERPLYDGQRDFDA